jgi:hypothetical protein
MRITWSERFNVYAGEEAALRACFDGLADAMDMPRDALWAWLLLREEERPSFTITTITTRPLPRPLRVALCAGDETAPALFARTTGGAAAIWLRAADPALRRQGVGRYVGDLEVEVSNPDEWRLAREGPMARHPQAGPCTVRVALRRLALARAELLAPPSEPPSSVLKAASALTERAASVLRLL